MIALVVLSCLLSDAYLLHGASVVSLVPGARVEAVLVVGGEIAVVGSLRECREALPVGGREVRFSGGTLTRGFFDGHARAMVGGQARRVLDLVGTADEGEMLDRVKMRAAEAEPGEWIVGFGFDEGAWLEAELPLRSTLDRTTELNPTVVVRYDGRSALANTSALHQAGVSESTPDPPGGWFERDEDGVPTGILHEAAIREVLRAAPAPTPAELLEGARLALELARAHGVTSFVDLGGRADVWDVLRRQGELTARVHVGGTLRGDLERWREVSEELAEFRDWIDAGALHVVLDGTVDAGTAVLFEPWTDDASRAPGLLIDEAELRERVAVADAEGFRVALHASGDRAVALALDVLADTAAENGTSGRRHRVERVELVRPEDVVRFAPLGVIASLQPASLLPALDAIPLRLGRERSERAFPWASLAAANAPIALGSGFPSAPFDPLGMAFAATARRSIVDPLAAPFEPEEALTPDQALLGSTLGPAFACRREAVLGPLSPGTWADLVHVDREPEELAGRGWLEARVTWTMVGGRVVYRVD